MVRDQRVLIEILIEKSQQWKKCDYEISRAKQQGTSPRCPPSGVFVGQPLPGNRIQNRRIKTAFSFRVRIMSEKRLLQKEFDLVECRTGVSFFLCESHAQNSKQTHCQIPWMDLRPM